MTSGGRSGIGKCLTVDPPVLLPTFTGILCSERVNIGAGSFRSRSLLMFEMCWPEVPICDNRIHELILPHPAFCRSLLAACAMRWISTPKISPQTHAESNSSTRSDLMLSAAKKPSSKFAAFLAVVRRMELQNDSLVIDVLSKTPYSKNVRSIKCISESFLSERFFLRVSFLRVDCLFCMWGFPFWELLVIVYMLLRAKSKYANHQGPASPSEKTWKPLWNESRPSN